MRFSNDQESIRLQVLRIFLIFHLRSLPRIKYFIHQQLYFYRFFWHFIDFRIIGILRLLGNIAQPFSLTVVKEGRFEWNPNTMKLQANLYTQHLLGVLFIYLLLVPRPWAVGTGHILRRGFFFLYYYLFLSELVLSLFRWRRVSSRAKNSTKHAKDDFLRKKYLHLKIKARSLFL